MLNRIIAVSALAALIALPLACSSDQSTATQDAKATNHFDPLSGDYPQIMWMVNVYEAPGPLRFGPGGVIEHERANEHRTMTFAPGALQFDHVFALVKPMPGSRNVAAPALFSKPGQHAVLEPGATDKAGQSIGQRRIDLAASFRNSDTLAVAVAARNGDDDGSNELRANNIDVADGGALALIVPSPNSDTWSVIIARPTVLRSVDDFPFQTSTMLPTEAPHDPLQGDYPQVFWTAEIYESPKGLEITDDSRVVYSTKAKPRGLGVIEAKDTQKLHESINALAEVREVSEPSILTKLDSTGRIEVGAKDKAGRAAVSRALEVKGSRADGGVRVESSIQNSIGEFSVGVNSGSANIVPPGGALVLVSPPPKEGGPMTLLVLRPRLIESAKDSSFQGAAPLTRRSQ